MFPRQNLLWLVQSLALICLLVVAPVTFSQTPQEPKPGDEVVRVYTELVQTDVMVFDKQGNFVNGLSKDKFEIKIDGQVRPIQFFEQIEAGTSNEEAQLAAARGTGLRPTASTPTKVVPLDRGRTIFFYVDDFHMDASAFVSSRKVLSDFVNKELGQNDQAAITSATGQIGFLQQLTDNRTVLQAAIKRLSVRTYSVADNDHPPMGEYEAMLLDNNDMELNDYFIRETIRANGGQMSRDQAASIVHGRAQSLLSQAAAFNVNTLSGLERLIRTAKDVPGRKVVFFLSNGFLVENRRGDTSSRIQRITSAAAKSGVVIYAIDTRGLTPPKGDASSSGSFDLQGVLARAASGEQFATQDGLNALSRDTGGKPIFNTNDFRPGLRGALQETAVYYLLAWKPDAENKKPGRFRNIQVNVIGRPDLTVRVRKGYFDLDPPPLTADAKKTPSPSPTPLTGTQDEQNKTLISKLRAAISAPYPVTSIPLTLGVNYYDSQNKGPILAASVQIPGEFLSFGPRGEKTQAVSDVTGVFYDDKGVPKANFYERLVTTAQSPEQALNYRGDITYTYPANVPPGLYQVRVAVRDDLSGRTGSVHAWIEVPDLIKGQLAMSSLLLGERNASTMTNVSSSTETPVLLNASHRFKADSTLRFLVFGYNAKYSETEKQADVAVQVQVIRDDQPVITTALRKISTEGLADPARIPYAAEIPLPGLQPGRYLLQVTFIDRLSKQSSSRQTHFDIY
jgi:VWFA-related protein